MSLVIPSRRRFLFGAGALLAAPAIVRVAANLMPISVQKLPDFTKPVDTIGYNVGDVVWRNASGTTFHWAVDGLKACRVDVPGGGWRADQTYAMVWDGSQWCAIAQAAAA